MVELLYGLELERESEKGTRVRETAGDGLVGVGLELTCGVCGGTWRPCTVRLTHTELAKPGYSGKLLILRTNRVMYWFRIEIFFLFSKLQN